MLHQVLWEANLDLARASLEQPFVQGLADGTLASGVFRVYVAQDAFFLRAFLGAYALGAARAGSLEQARTFHGFMGGVLEELDLHRGYAQRLGIDLDGVEPLPATRAYTDFLLRTAWSEGIDRILAAMVPCMRLYAWLGQGLAPRWREGHPYGEWIQAYSGEPFQALAAGIEALLDEVATDTPEVRDAYRYAMACEAAFFQAPLAFYNDKK